MRLIQVGVGGFGSGWTQIVADSPEFEPVAFVDINKKVLDEMGSTRGMPRNRRFTSLEAALAKVEAEAVLIVTPPASHRPLAEAAFKAGFHVLTEKPLAEKWGDCTAMVRAARRAERVLMVSQNYRYREAPRTIRGLIDQGAIGSPGYAQVSFHKAPKFPRSYRLEMDYPLLVDMSIHHFDLMRYVLNANPLSVLCYSFRPRWSWFKHEPACQARFHMTKDILVDYFGSWVSDGAETTWDGDWRIQGDKGCILWSQGAVRIAVAGEEARKVTIQTLRRSDRQLSLLEFHQAIVEHRAPETSGADNLHSIGMVFAALASAAGGRPKPIPQMAKAPARPKRKKA